MLARHQQHRAASAPGAHKDASLKLLNVSVTATQLGKVTKRVCCSASAASTSSNILDVTDAGSQPGISKRVALLSAVAATIAANASPANAAAAAQAGQYLPASGVDDLVTYIPTMTKTPSLRAGVIRDPYRVLVPPTWTEAKLANIATGNFCMPNCGEPWTEVVFENPAQGKLALLVSPLVKLTNKPNTPVQDLGTPEQLLERIGAFITGTYLEEDDFVAASTKVQDDGRTYYYYELYAPGANGHSLTAVTTKGEGLYLLVCSASDKAWKGSEKMLRKVVETFRA